MNLTNIGDYYTKLIQEHGAVPEGADWKSSEVQIKRFDKLLEICDQNPFVIGDYGCGYGALCEHLQQRGIACFYKGFDISKVMIEKAVEKWGGKDKVEFSTNEDVLIGSDYIIANGLFNIKLETPEDEWGSYVTETIDRFAKLATKGFAFNALINQSDADKKCSDLYYANPLKLFSLCKKYSRNVSLEYDSDLYLYDFTISVRF